MEGEDKELQQVEVGEAELLQLKQVEEVEGEHLLILVEEGEVVWKKNVQMMLFPRYSRKNQFWWI